MTSNIITIITGRLSRDPESSLMPNGTQVTNFSVPVERRWRNADGTQAKETTWNRISVFGGQAQACNDMLRKGSLVQVECKPSPGENGTPRIWTGSDGQPRCNYDYRANNVVFLSDFGNQSQNAPEIEEYDDVPF